MVNLLSKIFFLVLITSLLSACAENYSPYLIKQLNTNFMDEKTGVNVVDLRSDGQCPGTLTLRVINKEKRGEKYPYLSSMGGSFYLFPDQYNKQIVKYIENRLHGSGVETDDVVGKDIHVSIGEVKETVIPMVVAGLWKGWVELQISIPEIDYTQTYAGYDQSPKPVNSVTYATHNAVMKFLKDPIVQKYIQCR
jgi:hypothetical protein